MTLLRLATGLARSKAPEHRWRRLAVPLSALLFMGLVLTATSVVVMTERQNDRNAGRLPAIASSAAPTDLFMRLGGDRWRGRRIALAWIEPATPGGTPVLPPGVARFPEPGQAVVSPALARLLASDPAGARRYGQPAVIGDEGIETGGELVAYVRPPPGRSIGEEASAVRLQDGRFVGTGPVARVSGFGGRSGLFLGDSTSASHVAQAVFGLLCVPGLIVLMIGLSAASRVRDHRFQVLAAMGAPRRTLRAIAALESLVLAVPALLGAAAVWAVIMPRVDALPFLDYRLVRGDLAIPPWLLVAELIVATALCAGGSAAAVGVRRPRTAPRPVGDRGTLSPFAFVPLTGALMAFAAAGATGGDAAPRLNLVGITLVIAGTPLVLPALLRVAGASVSRSKSAALSLAGSAMTWDPRRLARPFTGLGALLVVALVAIGYTTLMTHSGEGRLSRAGLNTVSVEWHEPRAGDLARLDAGLATGLVLPIQRGDGHHGELSVAPHDHRSDADGTNGATVLPESAGHDPRADVALGATCARLASSIAALSCARADPYALAASQQRQLAAVLDLASPDGSAPGIRLVPRRELAGSGTALILDDSPLRALDERARSAAMAVLPAPIVESAIDREPVRNPWVRWIVIGGAVTGIALAIACLLALVDRLLAARQEHRHLLNLGISPPQMTLLTGALFAVPYGVMSGFALTTGLLICLMMLDSGVPFPWAAIAATILATLAIGGSGTGLVAALGSRQALREAE